MEEGREAITAEARMVRSWEWGTAVTVVVVVEDGAEMEVVEEEGAVVAMVAAAAVEVDAKARTSLVLFSLFETGGSSEWRCLEMLLEIWT